jgi:hypothetical protein
MLWHRILQSTSFIIAASILDRTESPNLRLMEEKVDSTFDRLWFTAEVRAVGQ